MICRLAELADELKVACPVADVFVRRAVRTRLLDVLGLFEVEIEIATASLAVAIYRCALEPELLRLFVGVVVRLVDHLNETRSTRIPIVGEERVVVHR